VQDIKHQGLSYSSMRLYTSCARKYFYKKVVKYPIDTDSSDDTESFSVGKAFHQCLEDTRHLLDGYTGKEISKVAVEHGLDDSYHLPLLIAMLSRYKEVHKKSGLKAIHCEVIIETQDFYGIVDVILKDALGGWWIGDMKTSGSYRPDIIATLPRDPQLNLYHAHYKELAASLELDPEKYLGCRYLLTTKSKTSRKDGEELTHYVGRLMKVIKSFDFIIPKEKMGPEDILKVHASVLKVSASQTLDPASYTPNYGNCMSYFRPCEFWSRCHGNNFSNMLDLEVITSG